MTIIADVKEARQGKQGAEGIGRAFTNRDRFFFILLSLGILAVAQLWVLGLPLWLLNWLFG